MCFFLIYDALYLNLAFQKHDWKAVTSTMKSSQGALQQSLHAVLTWQVQTPTHSNKDWLSLIHLTDFGGSCLENLFSSAAPVRPCILSTSGVVYLTSPGLFEFGESHMSAVGLIASSFPCRADGSQSCSCPFPCHLACTGFSPLP